MKKIFNQHNNQLPTRHNFAFTLAEVMIVLAVIGILIAILLPVAHNATPNENVMKFKKAHNTLYTAIRELVNSNEYYLDGDLSTKANGDLIDGTHEGDYSYFCNTFSDVLNAKEKNCPTDSYTQESHEGVVLNVREVWGGIAGQKAEADNYCRILQTLNYASVKIDKSTYYFSYGSPFGVSICRFSTTMQGVNESDCASYNDQLLFKEYEENSIDFYPMKLLFCVDIDEIGKGEEPFGYGLRWDGKILNGMRVDKWLDKSIQEKN